DDKATCNLLSVGLRQPGVEIVTRTDARQALALLATEDFDVVLTDLNMPGMTGIELCQRIVAQRPSLPVIVLTAFGNMESAIAAIRAGAFDFVTKPFEIEAVNVGVERAIRQHELREEVKRLRAALSAAGGFPGIIGASPTMTRLYPILERIADTDASLLITGESGTGKEVVARALHENGRRREGAFVAVNCAALPEQLLESELFGHVRGAFTDAKNSRSGLFVEANGGTVLLDEVGDMPIGLQPKLLRALESRKVRPLGGSGEVAFDARIVAATHRDLETMIEEGRFREDLYYRLAVISLGLPPLRARGDDVLLLAQHFLDHFAPTTGRNVVGIASAAAARLLAYSWPGNVRELRNAIERAVALTRFDRIGPEDLPDRVRDHVPQTPSLFPAASRSEPLVPLEDIERRYILKVLEAVGGNKSLAAETLGLNRKTLYRKLAAWGVEGE
ncbi:MAG TPA: sigma-54 dependent transcriptional regulator, partial [Polyangiaceae bacterium]|nr:sigma-54 dependent transcriptional regulator [Polyangiaceae bacterium]